MSPCGVSVHVHTHSNMSSRKHQQVEVDVRCDPPDTAAVAFLRRLAASHPAFVPVATALKLLLHQNGMDKVGEKYAALPINRSMY